MDIIKIPVFNVFKIDWRKTVNRVVVQLKTAIPVNCPATTFIFLNPLAESGPSCFQWYRLDAAPLLLQERHRAAFSRSKSADD